MTWNSPCRLASVAAKLFEAVVGNEIQRDHIIQGDLPGQAMNAEAAGERDDVIIDCRITGRLMAINLPRSRQVMVFSGSSIILATS